MEILIITSILVLIAGITWIKEPRIFLFLFNVLFFSHRKGKALNIDKDTFFPDSVLLETNWQVIANELAHVVSSSGELPKLHDVDKVHDKISFDEGPAWRTIMLKAYDAWFMENCERFPETYKLMKNMSCVETAMINILEPHVKIPPHTGKFSGVLRYHLGLSIPTDGECYLTVDGERYHWKNGEGVLFDDTYVHSVENNTNEFRAVLLLDIKKPAPAISKGPIKFLRAIIRSSPIFSRAVRDGKISLA